MVARVFEGAFRKKRMEKCRNLHKEERRFKKLNREEVANFRRLVRK
jgi:hypothetical protein